MLTAARQYNDKAEDSVTTYFFVSMEVDLQTRLLPLLCFVNSQYHRIH
jgi:hypothetical protein